MAKKCLKCGHLNEQAIGSVDLACPECGAVYAKVEARVLHYSSVSSAPQSEVLVEEQPSDKSRVKLVAVILGALLLGYLAGREHMKYEIQKAFAAASNAFASQTYPAIIAAEHAQQSRLLGWFEEPSMVQATLIEKTFVAADPYEGVLKDHLSYQIEFENNESADIRAFSGVVRLLDLLDNEIIAFSVSVNSPIKANQRLLWQEEVAYLPFMENHKKAQLADMQTIKTTFQPLKILYEDGTKKEF